MSTPRRGFTLIETMIYIGLLGFLMASTLVAVYSIVESGALTAQASGVHDEGTFVLRKMAWALGDAASVSTPSGTLVVTLHDSSNVTFRLSGETLEMKRGGGPWVPLTSENVKVTDADFSVSGGKVLISFTLDDIEFKEERAFRE